MILHQLEDRKPSSSFSRESTSRESTSRSVTPWFSNDSKASNGTKVREGDFSPRTRRLAISSKAYVRTSTIYNSQGPIPPTSRLSRMDFAWSTIKEASKNSKDPIMTDAFSRATNDDTTKKQLIKFVSETFSIVLPLLTYVTIRRCMEDQRLSVTSLPELVKEFEVSMV
jgi:hypothetical protein